MVSKTEVSEKEFTHLKLALERMELEMSGKRDYLMRFYKWISIFVTAFFILGTIGLFLNGMLFYAIEMIGPCFTGILVSYYVSKMNSETTTNSSAGLILSHHQERLDIDRDDLIREFRDKAFPSSVVKNS